LKNTIIIETKFTFKQDIIVNGATAKLIYLVGKKEKKLVAARINIPANMLSLPEIHMELIRKRERNREERNKRKLFIKRKMHHLKTAGKFMAAY